MRQQQANYSGSLVLQVLLTYDCQVTVGVYFWGVGLVLSLLTRHSSSNDNKECRAWMR